MTLLDEFRLLVAQARRKYPRGDEEKAIIAAGCALEHYLAIHEERDKPHIFEVVGLDV